VVSRDHSRRDALPPGVVVRVAAAIALRPSLWPTAIGALARTVSPNWWRRWPPIPRVPASFARFRAVTARGGEEPTIEAEDLVVWLEWCRSNAEHLH
jgi:hypothetical protein